MLFLKTTERRFRERLRGALPGHRATPPRQHLGQDGLDLGQNAVVSKSVRRHQLALAVLVQSLQIGGDGTVAGVAQGTLQFGDDRRNTADSLAASDHVAALQKGPCQDGSFQRALVQDFDEARGVGGQNPGLQVLGVIVGRCQHSDNYIANLSTDFNDFGSQTLAAPGRS